MEYLVKTERLTLRLPKLSDKERLFCLMSDKELTTFLTWNSHTNINSTETVIKALIKSQKEDKGYHWCICLDDKIIGLVSLIDIRRTMRTWTLNRGELSYWVGKEYQGKGFATEASKAIVNFGFIKLKLHKIIIAHAAKNIQSKKICKKLGFTKYAHEHDAFKKNNEWHDLLWYEQIKN